MARRVPAKKFETKETGKSFHKSKLGFSFFSFICQVTLNLHSSYLFKAFKWSWTQNDGLNHSNGSYHKSRHCINILTPTLLKKNGNSNIIIISVLIVVSLSPISGLLSVKRLLILYHLFLVFFYQNRLLILLLKKNAYFVQNKKINNNNTHKHYVFWSKSKKIIESQIKYISSILTVLDAFFNLQPSFASLFHKRNISYTFNFTFTPYNVPKIYIFSYEVINCSFF